MDLDLDSNSNEIPLPASGTGVTAAALRVGGSYIRNESLSLGAHFAAAWYSDTNRHLLADVDWTRRWWSGSIYKLTTRLSVSASSNTLTGAIYFNPLRDLSAEGQVVNDWTLWRRYGKIPYDSSHANTHTACQSHLKGHRLRRSKRISAGLERTWSVL